MQDLKDMQNIEQIIQSDFVVILAKTRSCSVCKPVGDRLDVMAEDYKNVNFYSVYVDEVEAFRGQFLLFTVPTVLMFSNGKELLRESRFINFSNITRLLNLYQNNNDI